MQVLWTEIKSSYLSSSIDFDIHFFHNWSLEYYSFPFSVAMAFFDTRNLFSKGDSNNDIWGRIIHAMGPKQSKLKNHLKPQNHFWHLLNETILWGV